MAKKKGFLIVLCSLLLSFVALCFSFMQHNQVFADAFDYNAQLINDNSTIGNYGISSIESGNLLLQYHYVFEIPGNTITGSLNSGVRTILTFAGSSTGNMPSQSSNFKALAFQFFPNLSWPDGLSYNTPYFRYFKISTDNGQYISFTSYNGTCWINVNNFSSSTIYTFDLVFDLKVSLSSSNLSACCDMLSDSNIVTSSLINNTFFNDLYNSSYNSQMISDSSGYDFTRYLSNNFSFTNSYNLLTSSDNLNLTNTYSMQFSGFSYLGLYYSRMHLNTCVSSDYLGVGNLSFNINRPTNRVDNTLVIYSYDYGLLESSLYCRYRLKKNEDYYNINYSGTFNNSTYNVVYNNEVENRVFDSYIYMLMAGSPFYYEISSNYSLFSLPKLKVSEIYHFWTNNNGNLSFDLGFDFNFVYYTKPLVANTGSYNYTFTKPGYVDVPGLLVNPGGWALAVAENVMIFFLFYCPIVSDIISFIHFDLFFGALISIINYILGSGVGLFILSCLSFLLFFYIVRSFMPIIYSSGVKSYNSFIAYETKKSKLAVEKNKKQQINNDFVKKYNSEKHKYKK